MAVKKRTPGKWDIDFTNLSRTHHRDPSGFLAHPSHGKGNLKHQSHEEPTDQSSLKLKKAWDVALAPAKSIPMNMFMLWMSGNGVQIFSMIITFMLFFQPIKAIMNIQSMFERYESSSKSQDYSLLAPKLVFIALQIAMMCLGLYKCSAMGLLPTSTSDWLAFMPPKHILEYSAM
ncbi:uncharacterized protein VTP21DRAFT_6645 [Calcarisporiella thermophila]|uniref:uncharacterized protein n=1 Tax=Calcarisporiella thermophila TaxID=911321 RepID=UPI003742BAB7